MSNIFPDNANLVLAIFANIFSGCIILSPLPRIVKLLKSQEMGFHDGLPYQMLWFSNALWIMYGCSVQLITVSAISGFGVIMGMTYVFIWISFLPIKDASRRLLHYVLFPILILLIIALSLIFFFGSTAIINQTSTILGWIASIVAVIFASSPLLSMAITKHIGSIDPWLSLAITVTCLTWTVYGIGIDNLFLAISNGIEFLLGLIELGFVCYSWICSKPYHLLTTVDTPKETYEKTESQMIHSLVLNATSNSTNDTHDMDLTIQSLSHIYI